MALYLGLQRAYLCLSQYETDCLGKERIQTPDSVPLNVRKLWGEKSLEKKSLSKLVGICKKNVEAQEQNPK